MFQYFVKVVPTIYYNLKGKALATNQFAVTKHQRPVRAATGENGLPGITMTHCVCVCYICHIQVFFSYMIYHHYWFN